MSLIAQGRFKEAYALARRPNPFASACGRICAHPCEAACRRAAVDAALDIRALKRVVTEKFGAESRTPFEEILAAVEKPRPKAEKAGRIAVIGAGPAGLSCAHDLALMGHKVVVFDAAKVTGGMMRLGIPEYRLPRELIDCEVDFIRWLGVEIRLGVEIGRELPFAKIAAEHDAVFIAAGCRKGRLVDLPGTSAQGVVTAVDFLAAVNLGIPVDLGPRVAVVGGGNVAFDVARTARRFGGTSQSEEEHHNLFLDAALVAARVLKRDVTMVALEAKEEMPADPIELVEASEEGVTILHRRGPKAILADDSGRVRALQTHDVSRVFDEAGRFSPQFVTGSEKELPCDTVVLAIGQVADLSFLGDDHGIEITPRKTIVVDKATLATSRRGVYAGGDVAFGPRIVIAAVADGRRAAKSIDTLLTGRSDEPRPYALRVFDTFGYDHPFARGDYERLERASLPTIPVAGRTQNAEVERVLDDDEAKKEGRRCLHCWVNTVFDSVAAAGSECVQCGGCSDVCPMECIDLISLVRVSRGEMEGAALIKDETACIRCGLCARRCPAGVITMQALYRADEAALASLADVAM